MKTKVLVGLANGGFVAALAGLTIAGGGLSPAPVGPQAGNDRDWNFWSDSSVLCPAQLTDDVGIGTATPDQKLHVVGSVKVEDKADVAVNLVSALGSECAVSFSATAEGVNQWRVAREGSTGGAAGEGAMG